VVTEAGELSSRVIRLLWFLSLSTIPWDMEMNVVVKVWPDLELTGVCVFLPINCEHYEIEGWLRLRENEENVAD